MGTHKERFSWNFETSCPEFKGKLKLPKFRIRKRLPKIDLELPSLEITNETIAFI